MPRLRSAPLRSPAISTPELTHSTTFAAQGEGDNATKKFKAERSNNKARKLKKIADEKRKLGCKKSFQLWRTRKEMCELALKR